MTNGAVNTTLTKKQRLWDWAKRWAERPAWWAVIIAALQLMVGAVLVILVAIFQANIQENAQKAVLYQQISSLVMGLHSEEPSKYEPSADALVGLGVEGRNKLLDFAATAPSLSWRKAHFLYKRIKSFAQDDIERKKGFEMLWSTWLSHDFNFGSDVQLYEAIKERPDIACPIAIRDLKRVRGERSDFSETALVVALALVCPQQNSAEIKAYRSHLIDELRETDLTLPPITFVTPWLGGYRGQSGPYEAKYLSFNEMVYGIRDLFQDADRYNTLSAELTLQPLWVRIVFEGVIDWQLTDKGTVTDDQKERLLRLVDLGFHSTDRDARYAALAVIGNLANRIPALQSYKAALLTMAGKDEDPGIRETAHQVLVMNFNL